MVQLTSEVHGDNGTPLVIAHGLYGSARNWRVIAKRLSDRRRVIAVDMRNHGDSPHADSQTYADLAGDLAETIEDIGGPVDLLGHSMGGKAAMVLALTRPDLISRLIVADIAPVTYAHTQMPMITAMQGLDLNGLTSRGVADKRLAQSIDDPAIRAFLLQSLELRADPPRWKLNLDVLAAFMPDIIGFPPLDGVFEKPTLFLTGLASDYVTEAHRPEILRLFPGAQHRGIPGAGHWLHAEKPREFEAEVRRFLDP